MFTPESWWFSRARIRRSSSRSRDHGLRNWASALPPKSHGNRIEVVVLQGELLDADEVGESDNTDMLPEGNGEEVARGRERDASREPAANSLLPVTLR